jgi:hypothetical protein
MLELLSIVKLWLGLRLLLGNSSFEAEQEFSLKDVFLEADVYFYRVGFSWRNRLSYFFLMPTPFSSPSLR